MSGVWSTIGTMLDGLNTQIGFVGSIVGLYDSIKGKITSSEQALQDAMRKTSKIAYEQYCKLADRSGGRLGIPLEKDVLGYLESCLRDNRLPSVEHMVGKGIASQEEAEVIFPYLMEQWMTIPEFSSWLHDFLTQNNQKALSEQLQKISQMVKTIEQFQSQADLQELRKMATVLSPTLVNAEEHACTDQDIKDYFLVNNNFHTMLRVISAGKDVPNQNPQAKIHALLHADPSTPVIITGNGGQGKTSLMMRMAVQKPNVCLTCCSRWRMRENGSCYALTTRMKGALRSAVYRPVGPAIPKYS